ncbi:MAG: M1 family aminopeptidase, partial [Flavobacteriales bacterium]
VAQTCISNGQERGITEGEDGYHTFHWHVSYPINNYNVTFNIGQYVHWHDVYTAQDGDTLSLDYYVKPENLEKSKKQFRQVKPMLSCYERYLGKYPFWKDGFALVETPYLGMEHQGAIAYGNKYMPGYMGWDRSGAKLQFDYIIIHETGHEWWGNSVSCSDLADMWIHEGFCTYTEAIYVECMHGEKAAQGYVNALKQDVANRQPIIGTYGINREGHGDMYVKGMLFLNSLRHTIDDDALWWSTIKYVSDTAFKITSVDYEQLVQVFEKKSGQTLRPIFEQFVKYAALPVLEYELCGRKKDKIKYQGAEIHVLLIDELTHFSEEIYRFLRGRCRIGALQVPDKYKAKLPLIICGSNPGGVGHQFVKETFIDNCEPMEIRQMPAEEGGMLRQFIPAKLADNPTMMLNDPFYANKLIGLG